MFGKTWIQEHSDWLIKYTRYLKLKKVSKFQNTMDGFLLNLLTNSCDSSTTPISESEVLYLSYIVDELKINARLTHRLLHSTQASFGLDASIPTKRAIAENYLASSICGCWEGFTNPRIVDAIIHIWENPTIQFDCENVVHVYSYFATEQKFPAIEELQAFLANLEAVANAPDEYCEDNRVFVPTKNLDQLVVDQSAEECQTCTICTQDMPRNTRIYTLSPCGHVFHADKAACLGEADIKTWLEKSKKCPACQREVRVDLKRKRPEESKD